MASSLMRALLASLATGLATSHAAAALPALRQKLHVEDDARYFKSWNGYVRASAMRRSHAVATGLVPSSVLAQQHAQLVRDINALYAAPQATGGASRPLAVQSHDRSIYSEVVPGERPPHTVLARHAPVAGFGARAPRTASPTAVPRPHGLHALRAAAAWWQRLLSYLPRFLR